MSEFINVLNSLFRRHTWIDQAAAPLQRVLNRVLGSGSPTADALNGVWLGHPLHPVLTDIPIGAWTAAVALDSIEAGSGSGGVAKGVAKAADAAVAIGVAGAVGSAVTGLADWQHTVGETRRTGMVHALLNTAALGLYLASLMARAGRNRGLGRSLALTGYALAGASAYLGGDMVYRQKMGINHAPAEEDLVVQDFVPVLAADQLPEGRPTIALLNTTPLVLLRRGEQVYALAETCAHLGGPLADGKLVDDVDGAPVVSCPWHGSHFDMSNGRVVQGPSAYPQPCFDARIHEGQIEVRRRAPQEEETV